MSKQHPLQNFVVRYEAGAPVFAEGDVGATMYIVQSGKVQLFRDTDGQKRVLGELDSRGVHPKISSFAQGTGAAPGVNFWRPGLVGSRLDVFGAVAFSLEEDHLLQLRLGKIPHRPDHAPSRRSELEAIGPGTAATNGPFWYVELRRRELASQRLAMGALHTASRFARTGLQRIEEERVLRRRAKGKAAASDGFLDAHRARLLAVVGEVHAREGRTEDAARARQQQLEAAVRSGNGAAQARALHELGRARLAKGELTLATRSFQQWLVGLDAATHETTQTCNNTLEIVQRDDNAAANQCGRSCVPLIGHCVE